MAIAVERHQLSRGEVLRRSIVSKDRLLQLSLVLIVLGAWQYVGMREGDFFLAPPTSVADAAVDVVVEGELWDVVGSTVVGIVIGFVIAAVIGVAIGTLMGTSKSAATALNPVVSAGYVI